MIGKRRHPIDKTKKFISIFMQLSTAFETIHHKLFFAKLNGMVFL